MTDRPARERIAVVTGVSRRIGIGFAIAERLLHDGFKVLLHSFSQQADDIGEDIASVLAELGGESDRLRHVQADFADPRAPCQVLDAAVESFGAVDALVVNHAHSSRQTLETVSIEELDQAWAVNARATILLAQAFAERHDNRRPHGRIVLFSSGQHLGPMPGELAYVVSKGAIREATRTLADELGERGITVNAVNPGPVDTGWPSEELRERLRHAFPSGRWGSPRDIAPVVAWLVSADSDWVTGQTIDAEGGFRRYFA